MMVIIFNWIYIFILSLILGMGIGLFIKRKTNYQIKGITPLLMIGLIAVTVWAQFVSIFYKVGLLANVLGVVVCGLLLWKNWKHFKEFLLRSFRECSITRFVLSAVLFFVFAFFTSRGYMHYDSDLYHGQSIRWIEEYGVVKGLGNLHNRFAYNSSFFALSAFYSMYFFGLKLHAVNGFIAWILSVSCLSLFCSRKEKRLFLSDFARITAIYYLTLIVDEIVSPASDFAVMCTIFYLVIALLDLFEKEKGNITSEVPYALICLGCAFAVTLKLTTGLLLIITAIPLCVLIKNHNWKRIGSYVLCGFLLVLPWLVRNVLISGYLIYPMTSLDVFPVDWKMPADIVNFDSDEIKVFGRALYDVSKIDVPVWEWFPNWFRTTLSTTERGIIILDFVSLVIIFFRLVWDIVKRNVQRLHLNILYFTVAASFSFWFLSAPLIRYGYVYALLLIALYWGEIICSIFERIHSLRLDSILYYGVLAACVLKCLMLGPYVISYSKQPYYMMQQDYGHYEVTSVEVDGQVIFVPVEGDRTGYDIFPTTPNVRENLSLRTSNVKDGFCIK